MLGVTVLTVCVWINVGINLKTEVRLPGRLGTREEGSNFLIALKSAEANTFGHSARKLNYRRVILEADFENIHNKRVVDLAIIKGESTYSFNSPQQDAFYGRDTLIINKLGALEYCMISANSIVSASKGEAVEVRGNRELFVCLDRETICLRRSHDNSSVWVAKPDVPYQSEPALATTDGNFIYVFLGEQLLTLNIGNGLIVKMTRLQKKVFRLQMLHNELYVAASDGLYLNAEAGLQRILEFPNEILCADLTSTGILAAADDCTLYTAVVSKKPIKKHSFPMEVYEMRFAARGTLIVADSRGLQLYNVQPDGVLAKSRVHIDIETRQ